MYYGQCWQRSTETCDVSRVFLEPDLARKVMSHDTILGKVFGLVYGGATRVLARCRDDEFAFDVSIKFEVLFVRTVARSRDTRKTIER